MYSYFKTEFLLFLLILGCIAFIPSKVEAKRLSAQETYNNQVTAYREGSRDHNGWRWGASYDYDPYFYDENSSTYYYDDPYYYENNGYYNGGGRVRAYRR